MKSTDTTSSGMPSTSPSQDLSNFVITVRPAKPVASCQICKGRVHTQQIGCPLGFEILTMAVVIAALICVPSFYGYYFQQKDSIPPKWLMPQQSIRDWHGLMGASTFFFAGFGCLVFVMYRCCAHGCTILIHIIITVAFLTCMYYTYYESGIGVLDVIDIDYLKQQEISFENETFAVKYLSLHSLVGHITVGLIAAEILSGLYAFSVILLCRMPRDRIIRLHSLLGLGVFFAVGVSCNTGVAFVRFQEYLARDPVYQKWLLAFILLICQIFILISCGLLPICITISHRQHAHDLANELKEIVQQRKLEQVCDFQSAVQ